jgi:hypothetical protein
MGSPEFYNSIPTGGKRILIFYRLGRGLTIKILDLHEGVGWGAGMS